MGIKTLIVKSAVPYIPIYEGNRADEHPTIVYIMPISTQDYRKIIMSKTNMNVSVAKGGDYSFDKVDPNVWVEATESVLSTCIKSVQNFSVEDISTGEKEEISNAEFFLGAAPDGLKEELFKACIDISVLNSGLKKT